MQEVRFSVWTQADVMLIFIQLLRAGATRLHSIVNSLPYATIWKRVFENIFKICSFFSARIPHDYHVLDRKYKYMINTLEASIQTLVVAAESLKSTPALLMVVSSL